jgi:two-component sensor histidine kinase
LVTPALSELPLIVGCWRAPQWKTHTKFSVQIRRYPRAAGTTWRWWVFDRRGGSHLDTGVIIGAVRDTVERAASEAVYKGKGDRKLVVCDEGKGLSDNFDPAKSASGLGMKIVDVMARQLGGAFSAGANPAGKGACFAVTLPDE